MRQPIILGLAGWSGSGKTTLAEQMIQALTQRGLRVSSLKHAHHEFDVDQPGKDSHRHRQAGAGQVLVTSRNRWALMTELRDAEELTLEAALTQLAPCDLVLVEGFKTETFPKLEVHRPALGKPLLHPESPGIVAIASDAALDTDLPVLDLNDLDSILTWVMNWIEPHGPAE